MMDFIIGFKNIEAAVRKFCLILDRLPLLQYAIDLLQLLLIILKLLRIHAFMLYPWDITWPSRMLKCLLRIVFLTIYIFPPNSFVSSHDHHILWFSYFLDLVVHCDGHFIRDILSWEVLASYQDVLRRVR